MHAHLKPRQAALLIALDETRQLGKAAERLHMSQPAASKALAQLEEQVGYHLFQRTHQGTQPTDAGLVMISHARHTVGLAERAAAELQAVQLRGSRLLRLGTLPSTAATLAPRLMAALFAHMPNMEITLIEGVLDDLLGKLEVNDVDIVLGRLGGRALPFDCDSIRLYDEPIGIVAAPGHALAGARAMRLEALTGHSWILPLAGTMMRERLEDAFEQAGLAVPAARVQTNSMLATLAQISSTNWLAAMPMAIAGYYQRLGALTILPLRMDANFGAVGAVFRRHATPAVQAALDWLSRDGRSGLVA